MHHTEQAAHGRDPTSTSSSTSSGAGQRPAEEHLFRRFRDRASVWDLVVLAAVPLVLVGVFALPSGTKRQLALNYAAPTVVTAFTSHFVHLSVTHLLTNLVGYLVVVPTGYALSVASGRRRQFFVVFASFLLSFPFLLSGLNLLFPRSSLGVGISGIVLAFVGYLPFAFMSFVGRQLDGAVGARHSPWLFFFGLGLVAFIAAPNVYGLGLAAAATLAGVRYLLPVVDAVDRTQLSSWRATLSVGGYAELAVLGGVVFLAYPFVAFPGNLTVSGGVLNVYTHALGFCLGYITTYVAELTGLLDVD